MTSEVVEVLRRAAKEKGLDPERFVVGSDSNSINPETGQIEFDDDKVSGAAASAQNGGSHGINDPATTNPTETSLGFDVNGPDEWNVVKQHPFSAVPAALTGLYARFADKPDNYSGSFHNDSADAYRHARWSQLMTQYIGPDLAKQFSDAREISAPDPEGERLMDLYNNQIGRGLLSGRNQVQSALTGGLLRTSPFIIK